MIRYNLRTLLIVLALGPPVLAGLWFCAPFAEWAIHFFADPLPHPDGGGQTPVTLSSIGSATAGLWGLIWPVFYLAAWIAVVIAWRRVTRPATH